MQDCISRWRDALWAICLVTFVFLPAHGITNSASADIVTEFKNLPADNERAVALVEFEEKICRAKGMIAPDKFQCYVDALLDVYRKIPNSLVGIDLLIEHYQRSVKISELVVVTRTLTVEKGEAELEASNQLYEDQLARRRQAARDYITALIQQQKDQQRAAEQAAAEAAEQEKKRRFNNALGELGRQMLQPKVYANPEPQQQEQTGCYRVGEQLQGFNKICFYQCMRGPVVSPGVV